MEPWTCLVDQLSQTGVLTDDRAEVRVRRELFEESFATIGQRRGTSGDAASALNRRAESKIESLRKGLRLYDVYFEGSSDIREGDRLWHIPEEWSETGHSHVLKDELKLAIYKLPVGSVARLRQRITGPVEDQYHAVEDTGERYAITPVDIDWDTFEAAFPITTTQEFRTFVEERYTHVVQNTVRKWFTKEAGTLDGLDLRREPQSLEISANDFVKWIIDWENVPKPDDDVTLEDRDRSHKALLVNHVHRYVDEKGYRDATHSFPRVVHDALDQATGGRYLFGFTYELEE